MMKYKIFKYEVGTMVIKEVQLLKSTSKPDV